MREQTAVTEAVFELRRDAAAVHVCHSSGGSLCVFCVYLALDVSRGHKDSSAVEQLCL